MEPTQDIEAEVSAELTPEQLVAFRKCTTGDKSVLCTGQGGTGKSKLIQCIVKYYRSQSRESDDLVAVTASTGVAAFLVKGITLHRFAGTGIEDTNTIEMIRRASSNISARYWKDTTILIIDEVSMVSRQFFDSLSIVAQHMRDSELPFGGIKLLMFGDFLQLPPVLKIPDRASRIFHSRVWNELDPDIVQLKTIMRQVDPVFTKVLTELRMGTCTSESENYISSLGRNIEYDDDIEPVRLFAKKNTTDIYNSNRLSQLTSSLKYYTAEDSGDLNMLKSCPAPDHLRLKIGAQVMLIRNLDTQAVNGSVGTVVGFSYSKAESSFQPDVKFAGFDGSSFIMNIGKVLWESISPTGIVLSRRVQVPLILAWAMTIHKSQGQTIPRLCVDLQGVFEYGQAYVALSRCPNPDQLQVINFKKHLIMADPGCITFYDNVNDNQRDTATYVARDTPSTETEWDREAVKSSLLDEYTKDTQIMLGHLSVQETSNSSPPDSEI